MKQHQPRRLVLIASIIVLYVGAVFIAVRWFIKL